MNESISAALNHDHALRKPWRERLQTLKNVRPFLGLLWSTGPALVVGYFAARLLRAAVPVATLYITKLIIDAVVHNLKGGTVQLSWLGKLIVIELTLAVLSDALGRFITIADNLLSDRVVNSVCIKLMRHASKLDLSQFEEPDYHDKLYRAQQVVRRMQLTTLLMSAAQDLLMLVIFASAIVTLLPWLLVILIFASLPVLLAEGHFAALGYSLLYRRTEQRRELEYVRSLGMDQKSAKEVKIFDLSDFLVRRYRTLADLFEHENRKLLIRRAAVGSVLTCIGTVGYYGAYAAILYQTLLGVLSVGALTFLVASFGRCRTLVEGLLNNLSGITEQAMQLEFFFAFFRTEPNIHSKEGALPIPRPIKDGIEFRHVSFCYPGSDRYALRDVNFKIQPGKPVALIGENGAGKSTVTKLLARLYDQTEGQILLDGIDLREYDVEEWRREIGVIFQDYVCYDMPFSENIGIGNLEHSHERSRLLRSTRLSLAANVAARLKHGFAQMLGRRFAGGVELSAGEWQKVALARSYMRDAQVLILDEPTAFHDARSEQIVFQNVAEFMRGKLMLLISHRLPNVRLAERILVLNEGRVFEEGTHRELLESNGLYAELFEMQASGYR